MVAVAERLPRCRSPAEESVMDDLSGTILQSWFGRIVTLTLLMTVLFSPLLAQEAEAEADAGPASGEMAADGQNLFELIQQGGWAMWPLGLCSLFMLFLIVYSFVQTQRGRFVPDGLVRELLPLAGSRNLELLRQRLQFGGSVAARVLAEAFERARPERSDGNREKVESVLLDYLEAEENSVGQWVNYLNVVAAVSPMIGLLGTVSGMISAFQTISLGGMGRPELLAGDIGEALITTATGLVIGIPAMVFYFILKNRLGSQMLVTVQAASTLVDAFVEAPPTGASEAVGE